MMVLRLIAAVVGLGACRRVNQGAKLKLLGGVSTTKGDCPTPVQEFEDLSCRDMDGEIVDFYCCNLLKTCRHESTALLAYSLDWNTKYEQECGVVFSDFDFAADMESLQFVGDELKLCAPGCQTSRVLAEKTAFGHTAAGLQEMCDGMVIAAVWEPQLESARWPMNKVDLLDELWQDCSPGGGPPSPPSPTPELPTTTTTTTRTMSLTAPVNPGVDFSFMTTDLTPIGGKKGILHWLNKLTLKRRQRNEEAHDEIAGGHICRDMGVPRDQTYYASSLCYWLPDIKKEIAQDHVGLDWNGGSAGFGQPLCEGVLSGQGKCLKCAVCHDNAMNEEGTVNFTSFIEEIALPSSCKMETEIEQTCVSNFYTLNAALKDENDRCVGLKGAFESAVSRHEQALALIQELNYSVETELPAKISEKQAAIAAQQALKLAAQATERAERSQITTDCYNYASRNGWPYWFYRADVESFPTGDLLDLMSIVCVHPGLGNSLGPYNDCLACKARYDSTKDAFDEFEEAEGLREEYQRHLDELEATLQRKTAELAHWNEQEPILAEARREKTELWDPETVSCENTFVAYQEAKMNFVSTCGTSFYDDSCEKACIEIQSMRSEGCGVMEGTMPLALTGRGGLRNTCRPPQHSWIHGPWNYGAPIEDAFDQCNRVWGLQEPSYAQEIKKAGWLLKSGRFGGWWFGLRKYTWNKRYFVLESGDAVRSGILRYFLSDPNTDVRAVERHNKFIILWDAQGTHTHPGSTFKRNDDACFELEHFYRKYIFCVEDGNKVDERNDWVSLINPEIRFPSS